MQRKTKPISFDYEKISNSMTSYLAVNRNGWFIKFSVFNGYNILLVFTSMFTGQTILRYYDNEDDAVKFINYIIECDPTEEIPQ
jgi:hypothetical protein